MLRQSLDSCPLKVHPLIFPSDLWLISSRSPPAAQNHGKFDRLQVHKSWAQMICLWWSCDMVQNKQAGQYSSWWASRSSSVTSVEFPFISYRKVNLVWIMSRLNCRSGDTQAIFFITMKRLILPLMKENEHTNRNIQLLIVYCFGWK